MLLVLSVLAACLGSVDSAPQACDAETTCADCINNNDKCGWGGQCIDCATFTESCAAQQGCEYDDAQNKCVGKRSGVCDSESDEDNGSKPNLGLILGLSLGGTAVVLVSYALWKYKPWSNRALSNGVEANL